MAGWAQLEACRHELNAAINVLARHGRNAEANSDFKVGNETQLSLPSDAPVEAHQARRSILTKLSELQTLLAETVHFLQELARQVGVTASRSPGMKLRSQLTVL